MLFNRKSSPSIFLGRGIAVIAFTVFLSTFALVSNSSPLHAQNQNTGSPTQQQQPQSIDTETAESRKYWTEHCQKLLGRFLDVKDFPEVVFFEKSYLELLDTFSDETISISLLGRKITHQLSVEARGVYALTEVWCARDKVSSSSGAIASYFLADIAIRKLASNELPTDPAPIAVDTSDIKYSRYAERKFWSATQIESQLKSDKFTLKPPDGFLSSTDELIKRDESNDSLPKNQRATISKINEPFKPPEVIQQLCPDRTNNTAGLQCEIVFCVEDNFEKLTVPGLSQDYFNYIPQTYPSFDRQIVGLETWFDNDYKFALFSRNSSSGHLSELVEDIYDEGKSIRSWGESSSEWAGDMEKCLDQGNSKNNSPITTTPVVPGRDGASRVGFWVYYENNNPDSPNQCAISVAVSDDSTPVCEQDGLTCLRADKNYPIAEGDRPFTALFTICPWGTSYDMGENPDSSDAFWCTAPYISDLAPTDIPLYDRIFSPLYKYYFNQCSYTYGRSSISEQGGVFKVRSTYWLYITCWMEQGQTCGTWWFNFPADFDMKVRDAQALETKD